MSSAGSYGAGGGGGVGSVKFLEGNSGGAVGPTLAGIINVVGAGDITVVGDAGTNTLTVELTGSLVSSIDGDAAGSVPISGDLNITGGTSGAQFLTSGITITESFNFLALPNTDNPLTQGYISVNGTPILAFYGGVIRHNTFLGYLSGNAAIASTRNTGIGFGTLSSITTGADNTALGDNAAPFVNTGNFNTALGQNAYNAGTDSNNNVAVGQNSLSALTSTGGGDGDNTAVGTNALSGIVSGTNNVALGYNAGSLFDAADSSNIVIGNTGSSGISNAIIIGTQGSGAGEQDTCNISGIYGSTVGGTNSAVFIDNAGNLGTLGGSAGGVTSITGNSGGALVGAISITGGTSGAFYTGTGGNTLTTTFTKLVMSDTTTTTGYIQIGGSIMLSAWGGVANINTFVGESSGNSAVSGSSNTAIGSTSLVGITSGTLNCAMGSGTLSHLTSGDTNTALGVASMFDATTAAGNSAVGYQSLENLLTGSFNISLGYQAAQNYTGAESSNITIGNTGTAAESNVIRIGTQGSGSGQQNAAYMAGIYGSSVGGTNALVFADNTGKLGTTGGTFSAVTSITGDAGGSVTGAVTLTGGTSGAVYTASGGNTLTTTFTKLNMPFTNIAGTQGVLQFGGVNVLGFYGGVGENNVLLGDSAGDASMSGSKNTGVGSGALSTITSGFDNTALGYNALGSITSANNNTALGEGALDNLVTGSSNIAIGNGAGSNYTTSETSNIVIGNTGTISEVHQIRIGTQGSGGGQQNLCNIAGIYGSTVGGTNAAVFIDNAGNLGTVGGSGGGGVSSITGNSGGALTGALTLSGGSSGGAFAGSGTTLTMSFNSLSLPDTNAGGTVGVIKINGSNVFALYGGSGNSNLNLGFNSGNTGVTTTGNTSIGANTQFSNTGGTDNTSVGNFSLSGLTSGNFNTGIGALSLQHVTTGGSNTCIGFQSGSSYTAGESGNICIGAPGVAAENDTIHIGDGGTQTSCFIGGIAGVTVASSAAVLINTSTGQLGTFSSSRRFKENIDDMGVASRDIYKLRPVKFNFKGDFNQSYGLIAEDVEEVAPYLVSYDSEGMPATVKYHELPALLLNEIQRLKFKIDELEGKLNARLR
jgi:trimeric autotransporter adhesin